MPSDTTAQHEAYQRSRKTLANPRDAEYLALSQATQQLLKAGDTGRSDLKLLIEAIHLNKSLWALMAQDCANDQNELPRETRAAIISLSRWVTDYSRDVMRKKEGVEPLVDVNRIIMEGLAGKAPAA